MLPTPLHNVPSANGRKGSADGLNRLSPNRRAQRKKLRRHAVLTVDALQVFVLAKKRLQHFAAADQPLASTRLATIAPRRISTHPPSFFSAEALMAKPAKRPRNESAAVA